jgi:hypothetical protein
MRLFYSSLSAAESRPVAASPGPSSGSTSAGRGATFGVMLVAFLVFAALWVLAWVVLIVLGLVNILFPRPDGAHDESGSFAGDSRP